MGEVRDLDETPHVKNLIPSMSQSPCPILPHHLTLAQVWWPQNTHLSQTEPQTLQRSLAMLLGVLSAGRLPGRKGNLDDQRDLRQYANPWY